ncbi:hypothetical protein CH72_640 [Burkholderia ambifaria AMMD]|nr:hypothetical protein CH72_640 [Burkholderia ambifaria AMMD]
MLLTYPYPAPRGYGTRGLFVGIYTINTHLDITRRGMGTDAHDKIPVVRGMWCSPDLMRFARMRQSARLPRTKNAGCGIRSFLCKIRERREIQCELLMLCRFCVFVYSGCLIA